MDKTTLLDLVKKTALEAGKEVMEIRSSGMLSAETKIDGSILTRADKRSQEIIVDSLSHLPATYVAEEKGSNVIAELNEKNKGSIYQIVIDPVDGTRPFKAGTDDFCISVGVTENKRPTVGVVYAPAQKKLYFAEKDKGAFMSLTESGVTYLLNTSNTNDFDKFKLAMNPRELLKGCYHDYFKELGFASVDLEKIKAGDISVPDDRLIFGYSSTLVFANVARGTADYAMTFVLAHPREPDGSPGKKGGRPVYDWDMAAIDLIITEAGGCMTDFEGNEIKYGTYDNAVLRKHAIATNSKDNHFRLLEDLNKKIDHEEIYSFNLK